MSQGDIGLNVAQMIVELIRDNRKIVDRVTREQIAEFVGLLRQNKVLLQFIAGPHQFHAVYSRKHQFIAVYSSSRLHQFITVYSRPHQFNAVYSRPQQ